MGAKVVHFEVMTSGDAAELGKFYSEIFGWNVDADNEFKYGLVTPQDAGIGGGIGGVPDPSMPSHVTFYVSVPDPEATLQDIESRGGKRLMGPEEVTPGTTIAMFQDPQGNVVGLSKE
ncbi:MAG: VOC family protein [Actinomycetota bacterium]